MIVVTSAAVFSDIDADHPVGEIRRVGGGKYRFVPGDGSPTPEDARDFLAAADLADAYVVELEKNPQATGETIQLKAALARIAELEQKLAELERDPKAGADVPAEVVGTVSASLDGPTIKAG